MNELRTIKRFHRTAREPLGDREREENELFIVSENQKTKKRKHSVLKSKRLAGYEPEKPKYQRQNQAETEKNKK